MQSIWPYSQDQTFDQYNSHAIQHQTSPSKLLLCPGPMSYFTTLHLSPSWLLCPDPMSHWTDSSVQVLYPALNLSSSHCFFYAPYNNFPFATMLTSLSRSYVQCYNILFLIELPVYISYGVKNQKPHFQNLLQARRITLHLISTSY